MSGSVRRTQAQIKADNAQIARYILQGKEQKWIADEMKLSASTISRAVTKIEKDWRESTLMNFNMARNRELAAVDMIEYEAWKAWFASKTTDVTTTSYGGEGVEMRVSLTERERYGDDRYMKIIQWCHEHRAKLMGLIVMRHEHTGKDGKAIALQHTVKELTDDELLKIAQGGDADAGSQ